MKEFPTFEEHMNEQRTDESFRDAIQRIEQEVGSLDDTTRQKVIDLLSELHIGPAQTETITRIINMIVQGVVGP